MPVHKATKADYEKLLADKRSLNGKVGGLTRENNQLKGLVETLRGQLKTASDLATELRGTLESERAARADQVAASVANAATAAVEAGPLPSDPRYMFLKAERPTKRLFANRDEVDAANEAAEIWYGSATDAVNAWREEQFTPLPEADLDGQTVAEATA